VAHTPVAEDGALVLCVLRSSFLPLCLAAALVDALAFGCCGLDALSPVYSVTSSHVALVLTVSSR
jgi:hypothetical protein